MAESHPQESIEELIEQWRSYLRQRRAAAGLDGAALERQLCAQITDLTRAGLAADEAFLIAVRRIGSIEPATAEFAREQSARLWRRLAVASADGGVRGAGARTEAWVAFGCAVLAAIFLKSPALFGISMDAHEEFYFRNASLLVLPCLLGYLGWKRRLAAGTCAWIAAAFAVGAVFANLPGWGAAHEFAPLTALHLPIALWLTVGVAHAGGRWREGERRMEFIRFSGELFLRYVLIALGGGVLTAFFALTFQSIEIKPDYIIGSWLIPCGAAGAVVVGAWLVEAKQMENLAPMLTRVFTPLFAVMLVAFLGTLLFSGRGIKFERELLIGFDLLLVVVLGLLVYSISARDPRAPRGFFDLQQLVLVIAALLANAAALWAIGARIGEFGFSPNRVAALGENVILLVNLAWSAVLYLRFMLGRVTFDRLERWQTGYVPVYAVWAAVVVILFPPLFQWLG